MSRIVLYATRTDLLGALAAVEALHELQYVRTGDHPGPDPTVYPRAADVPNLGVAKEGWSLEGDRWYIFPRTTRVVVDEVLLSGRASRYFVGARLNPDAVILLPGGRLDDRGVVQGGVNPVTKSETALSVFKLLRKVFRQTFTASGETLVGPEALALYRGGMRLAFSLHSPPESDFKLVGV